jgi:hypothetical protein
MVPKPTPMITLTNNEVGWNPAVPDLPWAGDTYVLKRSFTA